MLFSSYEFIFLFLPFSFFIYFLLLERHLITAAKSFLVFISLFFYSWWNISYLPIILSSMLFNYTIGNSLNKNIRTKNISKSYLLTIGIILNLSLLGYFKYTDFFLENLNFLFDKDIPLLHLTLPLAISFFTFQQIAYLVDSYRGETSEYNFLNYALFVTFFPQLIAGPIVHHSEMMPQFSSKWNLVKKYQNIAAGLCIFAIGLFKKVVIADTFAIWATTGFDNANSLNFFDAWGTSLSYTFQLYFDFSGYTDMAIGAALLFNIKLPINFNSPYKALNIQDFWRRWHITLSRFLRDYIYIPLGGNRKGAFQTSTNLLATFILGGIWHGAGWTFVFWGLLHGMALIIHRAWSKFNFTLPKVFAWIITFNFINISWVFFRAKEWSDAIKVLKGMFGFNGFPVSNNFAYLYNITIKQLSILLPKLSGISQKNFLFGFETYFYITLFSILVVFIKNTQEIQTNNTFSKKNMIATVFILCFSLIYMHYENSTIFIYFNF